jgi:hypothetical protein
VRFATGRCSLRARCYGVSQVIPIAQCVVAHTAVMISITRTALVDGTPRQMRIALTAGRVDTLRSLSLTFEQFRCEAQTILARNDSKCSRDRANCRNERADARLPSVAAPAVAPPHAPAAPASVRPGSSTAADANSCADEWYAVFRFLDSENSGRVDLLDFCDWCACACQVLQRMLGWWCFRLCSCVFRQGHGQRHAQRHCAAAFPPIAESGSHIAR